MKMILKGSPKEISSLLLELQGRREKETVEFRIDPKSLAKATHDKLQGS